MIYVLGSINMDMVANVPYMPKSGETLSADKFYTNPGGKGANQAVAIAKLGGEVKMIGKVGNDAFGAPLKEHLSAFGVNVDFITRAETNSGLAMIIVEKGDNRIILDKGANYAITEKDVDEGLFDAKEGDVLVMQLEIPLEIVEYAARLAKSKNMTVVLNPAPAVKLNENLMQYVDIVAPNESEAEILTGISPAGDVEIALTVKKLYALGAKRVIITLGGRGSVISEGQSITYIKPRKVKVVDTTSAGDTFIGAFVLKFAGGASAVEAANFASVASSITITREGAANSIPTLKEVQEVIDREKC